MLWAMRTWVLDLDGTLLHLPVEIQRVRQSLAELFQAAGVAAQLRPLLPGIERAARDASGGDANREHQLRLDAYQEIERFELDAAAGSEACPGARGFLEALAHDPVLIVTNNGGQAARAALEHCGLRPGDLRAVVGREPTRPAKPSPEPMLRALERLPGDPTEVICVGDRPADMAMAAAARPEVEAAGGTVRAVGVVGRLEGEAEMRAAGAEAVLPDLDAVLRYLQVT